MKDLPLTCALSCDVRRDGGRLVVRPAGELDLATVALVEDPLQEAWGDGVRAVDLDLRELTFIDSTGLHLLVRWVNRGQDDGVDMSVRVDGDGPVLRVLEVAGLLSVLPVETGSPNP